MAGGGRAERRRSRRLRRALGVVVLLGVAGGVVFVATRHGGSRPLIAGSQAATTTTTVDPGALPQTPDRPADVGFVLGGHIQSLWDAIVADDPNRAMPFFFPLSAYVQVKNISDPQHDWMTRLVANFDQDVHAWHARLGSAAASAQLLGLSIPESQAQWITPGVEYNKGSYWRVYGSMLNYAAGGRPGSFTIASMISWRGEWYVVHLASIR